MLELTPYFSSSKEDLEEEINWIIRDAVIKNAKGEIIFQQNDVEFPDFWSDQAVKIVADKYFRGILGTEQREESFREVVNRVVDTITNWGIEQKYFDKENARIFNLDLKYLVYHQYYSFNSPVWFNVGIEKDQQCSACFIQGLDDSMESIMELAKNEAFIFKGGSGSGTNFSNLRGRNENLSTGGKASGPVSFMRALDSFAGVIKSGGKTRRAAKAALLDCDHPDIKEFILSKKIEEDKAVALIREGYSINFEDEHSAYQSVELQNENHTVVIFDEFIQAVEENGTWLLKSRKNNKSIKVNARELFIKICEAAWACGDPGLFFDGVINRYHTCPASGKIRSFNPCLDGNTLMQTSSGLIPIKELVDKEFEIIDDEGNWKKSKGIYSGEKEVIKIYFSNGLELICTPDHKIALDGLINKRGLIDNNEFLAFNRAKNLSDQTAIRMSVNDVDFGDNSKQEIMCVDAILLGYGLGDGTSKRFQYDEDGNIKAVHNARIYLRTDGDDSDVELLFKNRFSDFNNVSDSEKYILSSVEFSDLWDKYSVDGRVFDRYISDYFLKSNKKLLASFLKGIFSANGCVLVKRNKVQLKTSSKKLAQQVVQCLCMFGIRSNIGKNNSKKVKFGNGEYLCKDSYNITISKAYLDNFNRYIGFVQESKKNKLLEIINSNSGGIYYNKIYVKKIKKFGKKKVYDFSVESDNHCGGAGGILVHNCGEFIDIDDSACNLGSFNLKRFIAKTENSFSFDIDAFKAAVWLATLAQEIIIDKASYPTEKIKNNAHKHRQLGIGYCNLGALLMYCGFPYDSDEGRALAAAISSLMTSSVYQMSGWIANVKGPFEVFEINKQAIRNVFQKHKYNVESKVITEFPEIKDILEAAIETWNDVLILVENNGIRNSKATLLAPTGTIGFMMDADTTGVEPELFLVKNKTLVGGGSIKIINNTMGQALINLGYSEKNITKILNYVESHGSMEGCKLIDEKHLPIFDTSYSAKPGGRLIDYQGHIKMVAAIQPHISGGISKTINMPNESTVEDVYDAFMMSYKLGCKAITIFRDGSKGSQPLNIDKKEKKENKIIKRKMPKEREAKCHDFNISGHKIYLHTGFFPDGTLGEIFIRASKEGSTMSGFLESIAILTSVALQNGVPLNVLIKKLAHISFEPNGYTGNREIGYAKSIVDYIFRYLDKYVQKEVQIKEKEIEKEIVENKNDINVDGPPCKRCGSIMYRRGSCYYCDGCNSSDGCS